MGDNSIKRRLTAILAADVASYTRLMEQDTDGTVIAWRAARSGVIDPGIAEFGGRAIKHTGDGFLAEFGSVTDAARCAIALQKRLATSPLKFRMGLNLGDVIEELGDIHGEGVNIAARLEALADEGGICISGSVYEQIRNRVDVNYADLGKQKVKNVSAPVQVYAIRIEPAPSNLIKAAVGEKPAIAVLPFANISGDPEQEYFADGMTEDIITELSKISGLLVIARNSAFAYKGKSVSMKKVGSDLNVGYVLEGSVRKAGNRLRISAQLIDAETDHHLWAERYDRDIEDIFAIQDEVARSVADALQVALLPDEKKRVGQPPTDNLEAYDIYLRTRSTPWPPTRQNLVRARSAYQRVIKMDPTFVGGYAGEAMTHALAACFGQTEDVANEAETATRLSARAIEIDDSCALAYSALGLANASIRRHEESVAAARKAVELQPSDADTHAYLGLILAHSDQSCAEAREELKAAIRLDPEFVGGPYLNFLGIINVFDRRFKDAIEMITGNMARGGQTGPGVLSALAAAYIAVGRVEDARSTIKQILDLDPYFNLRKLNLFVSAKNSQVATWHVEALRRAGMPE